MTMWKSRLSNRQQLGLGGAVLLALGAASGAAAVSYTRPTVEMAPTIATPVARLGATNGVVTVRGRVAAVYGDRFLVQDQSGRALVDAGRGGASGLSTGSPILVQGRYDNGQLRARYLVDAGGTIEEVGPRRPHPGPDGPPPPPGGRGAPPPPPPGGPGAPPPPPPGGAGAPPPPPSGAAPVAPGGPAAPPAMPVGQPAPAQAAPRQ